MRLGRSVSTAGLERTQNPSSTKAWGKHLTKQPSSLKKESMKTCRGSSRIAPHRTPWTLST
jgi:hypothetical protein